METLDFDIISYCFKRYSCCWSKFVLACQLLLQAQLTQSKINEGYQALVWFCKHFKEIYGPERCTPNMHMACHVKVCLLDYGIMSAFWCFPFERMNGILE